MWVCRCEKERYERRGRASARAVTRDVDLCLRSRRRWFFLERRRFSVFFFVNSSGYFFYKLSLALIRNNLNNIFKIARHVEQNNQNKFYK